MAARGRLKATAVGQNGRGPDEPTNRSGLVQNIRDATGASEEEVLHMLIECNNDMNETTSRLIDSAPRMRSLAARLPAAACSVRRRARLPLQ